MTLRILSTLIGCAVFVPQIICQQDQKHFAFHTPSANVSFTADSILRQDPEASAKHYASLVQLRGNVQIRSCCVQSPLRSNSRIAPKQVVTMRADEVDFNQETGEMEVRGNVRVNFRNYPR